MSAIINRDNGISGRRAARIVSAASPDFGIRPGSCTQLSENCDVVVVRWRPTTIEVTVIVSEEEFYLTPQGYNNQTWKYDTADGQRREIFLLNIANQFTKNE